IGGAGGSCNLTISDYKFGAGLLWLRLLKLAWRAVALHSIKQSRLHCPTARPRCSSVTSEGWWSREDLHLQGSQTLDLWGLLFPLNHSPKKLEPPPGIAPS